MLALFVLFALASAQTASDCMTFCMDYNATCMGIAPMNDIYTDMTACQNECMAFPIDANCPLGDIADAAMCGAGDSWGCRRYHLNVAMSNVSALAATHCPHSTPLSSPTADITATGALTMTQCGMMVPNTTQNGLIADFCNQVMDACGNYLNGMSYNACFMFYSMVSGAMDTSNYADGANRKFPLAAITGSGMPCRRYHIQVARDSGDHTTHCPHALMGADGCGTTCAFYCAMGAQICPSEFNSNCESDCAKLPAIADFTSITNKDAVCRIYHLSVAAQSTANAMTHCPHTSIKSTPDTCGTNGAGTASFSALLIAALALITKFAS